MDVSLARFGISTPDYSICMPFEHDALMKSFEDDHFRMML
jgi:hypothetical protein